MLDLVASRERMASSRKDLWQETIEKGITAHTKQKLPPQTVMYGTCNSQKECPGKDCRKCPSLIKCKEGDCTN